MTHDDINVAAKRWGREHLEAWRFWFKHWLPVAAGIFAVVGGLYAAGFINKPVWSSDLISVYNRIEKTGQKIDHQIVLSERRAKSQDRRIKKVQDQIKSVSSGIHELNTNMAVQKALTQRTDDKINKIGDKLDLLIRSFIPKP